MWSSVLRQYYAHGFSVRFLFVDDYVQMKKDIYSEFKDKIIERNMFESSCADDIELFVEVKRMVQKAIRNVLHEHYRTNEE